MGRKQNQELNTIISGPYSGKQIVFFKNGAGLIVGTDVFFSKETVSSINIVNTEDGNVVAGAIVAGLLGALIMDEAGYAMVEITWLSSEKSLAKMSKEDANNLIVASYNSIDEQLTNEEKNFMIEISTKSKAEVWELLSVKNKIINALLLTFGILFILLTIPSLVFLIEMEEIWWIIGVMLLPIIGVALIAVSINQFSEVSIKNKLLKDREKRND